jgi:hypothetical protein
MKKPTGRTGENDDRIHWCMAIEKKIMDTTHSGMLGFSSEDDGHMTKSGDDDEECGEEGGGQENDLFADSVQGDKAGHPNDDPICANPPRCSLPSMSHSTEQHCQATSATADEGVTPSAPTMDVHDALKKAGSTIKADKTKSLSNKNKDRTSIAGEIRPGAYERLADNAPFSQPKDDDDDNDDEVDDAREIL